MTEIDDGPMYRLQEVPGRGKGLVATRKILRGTRILSEEPIIRLPESPLDIKALQTSMCKQFDTLTPAQKESFLSMHNIYEEHSKDIQDAGSKYLGIFRTNYLPFGDHVEEGGIFLDACRINHDCANNAQKYWNESISRHTVHAKRDIDEGEEITIYYLRLLNSRQSRQDALRRKLGFTCSCRLCTLPADQSQELDSKLEEILRLDNLIGRNGMMGLLSSPLRQLRYVDQQVQLYNEIDPDDVGLPRAFFDAAQITIANSDAARATIFAERALRGWIVLEGDDSPIVLLAKTFFQQPLKDQLYGMSKAWKTSPEDVPQGLDSKEFDDWLWRREKPRQSGQLADFRNRVTFPAFEGLPHEYDLDPEYYASSGGTAYRPRRHWLFLGEIVHFGTLLRLQITLKDVEGETVPLFFYTESRGAELDPSLLKEGFTVAILYAEFHRFAFCEPGIRLEEPDNIKVEFPAQQRQQ